MDGARHLSLYVRCSVKKPLWKMKCTTKQPCLFVFSNSRVVCLFLFQLFLCHPYHFFHHISSDWATNFSRLFGGQVSIVAFLQRDPLLFCHFVFDRIRILIVDTVSLRFHDASFKLLNSFFPKSFASLCVGFPECIRLRKRILKCSQAITSFSRYIMGVSIMLTSF